MLWCRHDPVSLRLISYLISYIFTCVLLLSGVVKMFSFWYCLCCLLTLIGSVTILSGDFFQNVCSCWRGGWCQGESGEWDDGADQTWRRPPTGQKPGEQSKKSWLAFFFLVVFLVIPKFRFGSLRIINRTTFLSYGYQICVYLFLFSTGCFS